MSRSSSTIAALRKQPRIRIDLPTDIAEHVRERAQAAHRTCEQVARAMVVKALKAERETRATGEPWR